VQGEAFRACSGVDEDNSQEATMANRDLFLPPETYPAWRPARRAARAPVPRNGHPAVHLFAAACILVASWIGRAYQRKALAELDDRMLQDIGITRYDAARECAKPFWR
jgi:uncharacterized protein YjiS (DUF1127 family)